MFSSVFVFFIFPFSFFLIFSHSFFFYISFFPSFRPFLENVDHEVKPSIFRVQSLETKGEERKIVVPLVVAFFIYFWLLFLLFVGCFVVLWFCCYVLVVWATTRTKEKQHQKTTKCFTESFFVCWFGVILRFGVFLFCLILVFVLIVVILVVVAPEHPKKKTAN